MNNTAQKGTVHTVRHCVQPLRYETLAGVEWLSQCNRAKDNTWLWRRYITPFCLNAVLYFIMRIQCLDDKLSWTHAKVFYHVLLVQSSFKDTRTTTSKISRFTMWNFDIFPFSKLHLFKIRFLNSFAITFDTSLWMIMMMMMMMFFSFIL